MKGPHARHTFSAVKHTSILNLTIAHSKRNSNHAYNQLQTGVQDILGNATKPTSRTAIPTSGLCHVSQRLLDLPAVLKTFRAGELQH